MADVKWTQDQLNAINGRSGTLLLSAAAGSGKTAVLVQRIIGLLTDKNAPVSPENLLVVTFTNAAAAEMRDRIARAVNKLIEENPREPGYCEIRMKLPDANICTMDSFCIKLVRENYHALGIEPDFTVLDDSVLVSMSADAMNTVMDRFCCEKPDEYSLLTSLTSTGSGDSGLSGKIKELYDNSRSHPFPEKWLDDVCLSFENEEGSENRKKIIREYGTDALDMCRNIVCAAYDICQTDDEIFTRYSDGLDDVKTLIDKLSDIIENGTWDEAVREMTGVVFPKLGTAPRGRSEDPVAESVKKKYGIIKKILKEKLPNFFCATDEENEEDNKLLSHTVRLMCGLVSEYGRELDSLKKKKNSYCFADFMHMALRLTVELKDGQTVRTPLAEKLSEQFEEILIDEYQDTNDAQDRFFSALSRNDGNLFTVGDVKQSIYSFRLARPKLFVDKAHAYKMYDGASSPAKIILSKNFRSRKGILDSVNFLFSQLMTEKMCSMDYDENEMLYYGGGYDNEDECRTELHFVEYKGSTDSHTDASYIGSLIKDTMENVSVFDKGVYRKARFGDFCVLLRSTKNKADEYSKTLNSMGIPTYSEKKMSLFDTPEVNQVLSFLGAVDNPSDDISVLASLYSPVYGFTPDEIASVRCLDRHASLFACLKLSAEKGDTHARQFIEDTEKYRYLSAVMKVSEFIGMLYEESCWPQTVNAMNGGDGRQYNLYMLRELASSFEDSGSQGLGAFIRYLKRSIENGAEIPAAADVSSSADVVRIYSIHKSKGLEFPFVILADCNKQFNLMDYNTADMITDADLGIGMKIIEADKLKKYTTLSHTAAKINGIRNAKAEEMRILYVAMTRAREKLMIVSHVKDMAKKIGSANDYCSGSDTVHYFAASECNSYTDWLLMAYLKHRDSVHIRNTYGGCDMNYIDSDCRLKFIVAENYSAEEADSEAVEEALPDENIIEAVCRKTEFAYPYEAFSRVAAKRTASEFEKNRFSPEHFAKSKPAFMCTDRLSAAEVGTANHIFLQCCDFEKAAADINAECARLADEGVLTAVQISSLNRTHLAAFFDSDLCRRMMTADKLYREKQFSVNIEAGVFDDTLPEYAKHEPVFVQGMADAVFVENGKAYIVDYKTDRVNYADVLADRYSRQLNIYRLAMEQTLKIPVGGMYIYSVHLGEWIRL